MLVLCSPDDGGPPAAVLGAGREGGGWRHSSGLLTPSRGSTVHRQWGPGADNLRSLGLSFFIYKLGLIVSTAHDCKVIFLFLKNIS